MNPAAFLWVALCVIIFCLPFAPAGVFFKHGFEWSAVNYAPLVTIGVMLAELDRTGEDQISLTDPDSRAMAAHTHVAVGYNVQVAVDTKHKLIVEQQVTNQVLDMGLLTETAEPASKS
jgi:hypothetical protein